MSRVGTLAALFAARNRVGVATELYDFTLGTMPSALSVLGFVNSGPSTQINAAGQHVPATLISGSNYQPRFMYHPATGQCLGLITEQSSTNLWAGHSCASPQLPSQSRTVTAINHTVSFNGTGTIVLSGAHSATIAGTGANVRRIYRFTATAGTLTATVSGTVTHANLEFGDVASTYIENTNSVGTNATRPDDPDWFVTGTAFTDLWDGSSARTILFEYYEFGIHPTTRDIIHFDRPGSSGYIGVYNPSAPQHIIAGNSTGGFVGVIPAGSTAPSGTYMAPVRNRGVFTLSGGVAKVSINGLAPAALNSATYPVFNRIKMGGSTITSGGRANMIWSKIGFRPGAISDSAMQALSAL